MNERRFDVVIIGSGAGGGTAALALSPLARQGKKILVLEQGPRFRDEEFTGKELEMCGVLYEEGGGVLNAEKSMTLAYGRAYGGSTVVYTGTSLTAPERVLKEWNIPGLTHEDILTRSKKYAEQNNVHLLEERFLNDNNRFFRDGGRKAGFHVEQFPLNLKDCQGSSLCNLGCPNQAKQGTHRVQLPRAEQAGVEVVTRATALRITAQKEIFVRVAERRPNEKGEPSTWAPGEYRIQASVIIVAGGAVGSSALLLRSDFADRLPELGRGFTCHPAHILTGEHTHALTNDVGHPKSFFIDRSVEEKFVLETCMYFPFTTAKNLSGFGTEHESFIRAYPQLQMILILACDRAVPQNRITVDRNGKPIIHYTFTPEVIEALVAGTRASARVFFAAGAQRVHAPAARPHIIDRSESELLDERVHTRHFLPGMISVSAAHLMGGCRMGLDAAGSVTDNWGRVHGLPWLRVADSSLFPDALQINPYLTIMALADRTAEMILNEAGDFLV